MPRAKIPSLPQGYTTFRIRRQWASIGELRVASGTDNPKVFAAINTMLDELANKGRWSDLNAIRNGTIAPLLAYEKWKKGSLNGTISLKMSVDVELGLNNWLAKLQRRPSTKRGYANKIKQLVKNIKRGETQADLPAILKRARVAAEKSKHHNSFNQTKMMLMAHLRDVYGKHSEIYRDVRAVPKFRLEGSNAKRPLSVKEVAALCKKIGRDDVTKIIWTLCTTGARGEGEYWDIAGMIPSKPFISVEGDWILVQGSKTKNSVREIPLIMNPSKATLSRAALSHILDDHRPDKQVSIYSFRKSYSTWLEEAGLPLSRRNAYRGHSKISMADTYEAAQTRRFLAQDAVTLQNFIKSELAKDDTATPATVKPMDVAELMG